MWLEANAANVQLAVETYDVRLEKRSFNPNRQITDASVEQSLIRDEAPFESRRHRADCSSRVDCLPEVCLTVARRSVPFIGPVRRVLVGLENAGRFAADRKSDLLLATAEHWNAGSILFPRWPGLAPYHLFQ